MWSTTGVPAMFTSLYYLKLIGKHWWSAHYHNGVVDYLGDCVLSRLGHVQVCRLSNCHIDCCNNLAVHLYTYYLLYSNMCTYVRNFKYLCTCTLYSYKPLTVVTLKTLIIRSNNQNCDSKLKCLKTESFLIDFSIVLLWSKELQILTLSNSNKKWNGKKVFWNISL